MKNDGKKWEAIINRSLTLFADFHCRIPDTKGPQENKGLDFGGCNKNGLSFWVEAKSTVKDALYKDFISENQWEKFVKWPNVYIAMAWGMTRSRPLKASMVPSYVFMDTMFPNGFEGRAKSVGFKDFDPVYELIICDSRRINMPGSKRWYAFPTAFHPNLPNFQV